MDAAVSPRRWARFVSRTSMTSAQELARHTPDSPTLLTVGVFDGVHLGHLSLLKTLRQIAEERGLLPGVVTFSPHPAEVVRPGERLPLLTTIEERMKLITIAGVPLVVPLTFTMELSQYAPGDFVRLLMRHLRMAGLLLGPDFSLGRDRAGTIAALCALGSRLGFEVDSVAPHTLDGQIVSSTAIRSALARGDVETAASMLGRPFAMSGPVITTSKRGASLGFPTANLAPDPGRALPRNGVYATIATTPNGRFAAVTNIGHRPTFGHTERVVETHILDFCGHLYETTLSVEFIEKLRDEVPFQSQGELVAQIHRDVQAARRILGEHI